MKLINSAPVVVVADDDEDDRLLVRRAFDAVRGDLQVVFVCDGEELLEYLRSTGTPASPRPHLVLLDLNMPRMGGHEALIEIRGDARLAPLPVVVLTTSHADADVLAAYRSGANSYLTKPLAFDALVDSLRMLASYWFERVELPCVDDQASA